MKWLSKYKDDDIRVIKRFLFIPWKLGNEWRWLESAYIREVYYIDGWLEKRWASREDYMSYTLQQALKYLNITPEMVSEEFKPFCP